MTTRRVLFSLTLLMPLLHTGATAARAQSTYDAVVGTVADTTRAILPGATVTLTDTGAGLVRTTASNAAGGYEFQNLTQGRYSVTVELTGFRKLVTESPTTAASRRSPRAGPLPARACSAAAWS
jgi:hypothetical protein